MITKLLHFDGKDEHGNVFVEHFVPGSSMMKTASAVHPDVMEFMADLKPDPDHVYVLLNALGASEIWGQNANGDVFPEYALKHAPPDFDKISPRDTQKRLQALRSMPRPYGYATFYNAHPYKHHVNKNPERSFGNVLLAAWNDVMKRVELIVALSRKRAQEFGGTDVLNKIEDGEYPSCSMGCRVPFDRCTYCDHISKTRNDYCEHAKSMMNQIMPNGIQIGVINTLPTFFDISFVFVGAEKTAKMMAKLANQGRILVQVPATLLKQSSAEVAHRLGYTAPLSMEKVASIGGVYSQRSEDHPSIARSLIATPTGRRALSSGVGAALHLPRTERVLLSRALSGAARHAAEEVEKKAAQKKLGDIHKIIPPDGTTGKVMDRLEANEPDLPDELLEQEGLKGRDHVSKLLSSLGSLGVVLKPREFQKVLLVSVGKPNHARELDEAKEIFGPVDRIDRSIPIGEKHIHRKLRSSLAHVIPQRSCLGPVMRRRISIISIPEKGRSTVDLPREVENPILDRVSSAYNGYRLGLIDLLPKIIPSLEDDSTVQKELFRDSIDDAFTGLNRPSLQGTLRLFLSLLPLLYMASGHWRAQKTFGGGGKMLSELLRDCPELAATLLIGDGGCGPAGGDRLLTRSLLREMA